MAFNTINNLSPPSAAAFNNMEDYKHALERYMQAADMASAIPSHHKYQASQGYADPGHIHSPGSYVSSGIYGGHPTMQQHATMNSAQYSSAALKRMIAMRLRTGEAEALLPGYPFFECHEAKKTGKVFVCLISEDGQPITIEDDADLFPSDTLITQLRLLKKP